jgi:XapX domain-containing protein
MNHVTLGGVELAASGVGLFTGMLYGALKLPIPAPNVLGGIFAIWGTFIGLVIVQAIQGQVTFF